MVYPMSEVRNMLRERSFASPVSEEIPELGDVLDFMRVLWAVDHGLHSTSKRMNRRMGITGPQRLVVRILGQAPGISAGTLARVMHIHPSTLTGVLQRLETQGMVHRATDPHDGRRALMRLTPRGEELNDHEPGTVEESIAAVLHRQAPESIAEAVKVLLAIAEELGVAEPL
jgi:DNA-binding MarR family transcriptional regulator